MWRIRFGTKLKCLNQKNFKEPLITIAKKLHKNSLKSILTLKAQFENIFDDIFWDFFNIHLTIIVFFCKKIFNVLFKDI
jgi:hypothetical protein